MIPVKELLKEILTLNRAEKYKEVLDKLPDDLLESYENVDLYAEKALASYRLNKYDICTKVVAKALSINPLHAKANHYKGNLHDNIDESEQAIACYKRAIESDPTLVLPYTGLGGVYFHLKMHKEAIEWSTKALELDPTFLFAYYQLSEIHLSLGEDEKALEYLNRALKIEPENIESIIAMAVFYGDKDQTDKALEYYNKAIELSPNSASTFIYLGNFYYNNKQYQEANNSYSRALAGDPSSTEAHINIGDTYHKLEEYQKAIEAYDKALKIEPNNVDIYNGLGNCYYALHQYYKAIDTYSNALEINPQYDIALYNRALSYFELKIYREALSDYELYLSISKNASDFYKKTAESRIEELRKILNNSTYTRISELVEKIKKLLLFTDDCVTHYTSLSVTKLLILDDSPFRLSEGAFLNDTSEGRELFVYLSFQATQANGSEILAQPFAAKPFIGSFVAENKHDDLTLWRMYGKEAKEEAKGCAITIKKEAFLKLLQNKLTPDDKTSNQLKVDVEFNFYRVAYRKKDTDMFIIPGAEMYEEELNNYTKEVRNQIDVFKQEEKDNVVDKQNILGLLNEISYLFKSAEYQYEHEVRLVIKGIGFNKFILKDAQPPRVYIELIPINSVLTQMTLGPKVERADEWASAFYYSLDKKDYRPTLLISHLPFK